MSKKPNAMGRIEGEPKMSKIKQVKWGAIGKVAMVISLVLLGVAGTLQYQQTISNIKAEGVQEYKASNCQKYSDKGATWTECEVKRGKQ